MASLRDRLIPHSDQDSLAKASTNLGPRAATSLSRPNLFNESAGLPQGWNSFRDRYGRTYYCNFNTNTTQFENPLTNHKDSSQHTNSALPNDPPSVDARTPYYLWHTTISNQTAPEQYWYENEDSQPSPIPNPQSPHNTQYHANLSQEQYLISAPVLTTDQLNSVPRRPIKDEYTKPHDLRQLFNSLSWVVRTHILLAFLFVVMVFCFSGGLWWGVVYFLKRPMWWWTRIAGPPQFAAFCLAYATYFILYVLPTIPFCCFPCLDCGWAGFCVSLDVMTPLKHRFNNRTLTQSEVISKIEQFERDIPVLAVISESYHYPSEDCLHDANAVNASDYQVLEVSKMSSGINATSSKNSSSDSSSWWKQSNEPILSQRIRRPIPIVRHRDISTPVSIIKQRLLSTDSNPYGVVNIRYTSRFELHPMQLPMLDSLLKQHYYHAYTYDLHTDSHIDYLVGSESQLYLEHTYQDVMFTNNFETIQVRQGAKKAYKQGQSEQQHQRNAGCLFRFCFEWNIGFFLALWSGFYLLALTLWKSHSATYTYHNIKYLQIEPFPTPVAVPSSSSSSLSPSDANSRRSSVSTNLFSKPATIELNNGINNENGPRRYFVLDQVQFQGPRARTTGSRPLHHQFPTIDPSEAQTQSTQGYYNGTAAFSTNFNTSTTTQSQPQYDTPSSAGNNNNAIYDSYTTIQQQSQQSPQQSRPSSSTSQRPSTPDGKKRPSIMNSLQNTNSPGQPQMTSVELILEPGPSLDSPEANTLSQAMNTNFNPSPVSQSLPQPQPQPQHLPTANSSISKTKRLPPPKPRNEQ